MRDIAVMCDVNGDVVPEYAQTEDIKIFPQYYYFDNNVMYGDEKHLTHDEFYTRLKKGEVAHSCGCNPERVRGILEEALKQNKDIIAIMASSACSGSYNTVCYQAEDLMKKYPGSRIHVVDTYLEAGMCGMCAYIAQEAKKQGKTFDEIVELVEEKKRHINGFFIVDDLDCLVRGGRLSVVGGTLGTLLKIKPVLWVKDGLIGPFAKCRGKKAAKQLIIDEIKKYDIDKEMGFYADTLAYDEAEEFANEISKEIGVKLIWHTRVNPTIGAHTGPGVIGFGFVAKDAFY